MTKVTATEYTIKQYWGISQQHMRNQVVNYTSLPWLRSYIGHACMAAWGYLVAVLLSIYFFEDDSFKELTLVVTYATPVMFISFLIVLSMWGYRPILVITGILLFYFLLQPIFDKTMTELYALVPLYFWVLILMRKAYHCETEYARYSRAFSHEVLSRAEIYWMHFIRIVIAGSVAVIVLTLANFHIFYSKEEKPDFMFHKLDEGGILFFFEDEFSIWMPSYPTVTLEQRGNLTTGNKITNLGFSAKDSAGMTFFVTRVLNQSIPVPDEFDPRAIVQTKITLSKQAETIVSDTVSHQGTVGLLVCSYLPLKDSVLTSILITPVFGDGMVLQITSKEFSHDLIPKAKAWLRTLKAHQFIVNIPRFYIY